MNAALWTRAARQGDVQPLGLQPLIQRGIVQRQLSRLQRRIDLGLQPIQRRTGDLAFLGRHLAQFAHLQADLALLAQPHTFQRVRTRSRAGLGQILRSEFLDTVHEIRPSRLVLLAPWPRQWRG